MPGLPPLCIPAMSCCLGEEKTPEAFVGHIVAVFREVWRVLRDGATCWVNFGDSYNAGRNGGHPGGKKQWKPEQEKYPERSGANVPGLKPKDLLGIPWRVAFALQADGWTLRMDNIWAKPNPMPESVKDRPTRAHEYVFLFSKGERYFYDAGAIAEPIKPESIKRFNSAHDGEADATKHQVLGGTYSRPVKEILKGQKGNTNRNKRSVWTVTTRPYKGAHFATFPPDLIRPCIRAGCPKGGTVLDPFGGSGTSAAVAVEEGRGAIIIELNPAYLDDLARQRVAKAREGLGLFAPAP